MSELLFNPFDPAFRANPYPFYDRLRTEAPVYPTPFGTFVLTRYEDIAFTLRSNEFSRDIEAHAAEPATEFAKQRRERAKLRTKSILNLMTVRRQPVSKQTRSRHPCADLQVVVAAGSLTTLWPGDDGLPPFRFRARVRGLASNRRAVPVEERLE